MNSKIDTAAKIDSVSRGLKESAIQEHLEKLAEWGYAEFHEIDRFWGSPLVEMFVDLCVKRPIKDVDLSSFSKIVHPKFPGLIPILDPLLPATTERCKLAGGCRPKIPGSLNSS